MYLYFFKAFLFLTLFSLFSTSVFSQEVPPELKNRYEQSNAHRVSKAKLGESIVPDTLSLFDLLEVGDSFNLALKNSYGVNLDVLADQVTSTNTQRDLWRNAREPRETIPNPSSLTSELYKAFVTAQIEANNLNILITDSSKSVFKDGVDITASTEASVLLLRGISKAYLGLIYDQGVITDSLGFLGEFDITGLELDLVSYQTLIESGLLDIETAIQLASEINEESFQLEILPTPSEITKARFLKIAHSMAAKILISAPRSSSAVIDYNSVLEHARQGLNEEYPNIIFNTTIIENPPNKSPQHKIFMADFYNDWSNFVVGCSNNSLSTCSGYVPTDVKVMHLLDSTYSKIYPTEHASQLDYREAITNDPRLSYFSYTQNAGFLQATKDSTLLSNYFSRRAYGNGDWSDERYPIILMTQAELQYIIAESEAALSNFSEANVALQNSPYGSIPADFEVDLPSVQNGHSNSDGLALNGAELSNNFDLFVDELHKEYSVEIGTFTTIGTNLFFMRRHDLLQELTATQLPLPAEVLEAKGLDIYTFGGLENSAREGTASGDNAWKTTTELSKPFGLSANLRNKEVEIFWEYYPIEITGYRLTNELLGYNETFPREVTSVMIDSLTNGTIYTFKLSVFNETQETETIEIDVMPTIFGGNNSFVFDQEDTFVNQVNTESVTLKNYLDIPITIDSVKISSDYEDPENREHDEYKYFYQDWREFFSLSHSEAVIEVGDSLDFEITFEPELWGVHPLTHIVFYTSDGIFKLLHNPSKFGDTIKGGYVQVYFEEVEGYSYHNSFFNTPDSVNFGEIEIGKRDSSKIIFKNKSTGTFFVNSFSSQRLIIENGIVIEVRDGFPEFSFSDVQDTLVIPPKDSLSFWVYAEPLKEEKYFAHPRIYGPENRSTISRLQGFNMGPIIMTGIPGNPVSNEEEEGILTYRLSNNYPNPFNPSTNIEFIIPKTSDVKLTIYNVLGQRVTTLLNKKMSIGKHLVTFNASNLSSGMYFYRLEADGFISTKQMLLIK